MQVQVQDAYGSSWTGMDVIEAGWYFADRELHGYIQGLGDGYLCYAHELRTRCCLSGCGTKRSFPPAKERERVEGEALMGGQRSLGHSSCYRDR